MHTYPGSIFMIHIPKAIIIRIVSCRGSLMKLCWFELLLLKFTHAMFNWSIESAQTFFIVSFWSLITTVFMRSENLKTLLISFLWFFLLKIRMDMSKTQQIMTKAKLRDDFNAITLKITRVVSLPLWQDCVHAAVNANLVTDCIPCNSL